ncbi:hypothetical protein [Allohahella marinimesophila]|uniref:Uncharacterized protein n=1 Tax=Allohahella marinimesophila TaxID=1054972 RepID=A0ABP7QAH8_9GAMM
MDNLTGIELLKIMLAEGEQSGKSDSGYESFIAELEADANQALSFEANPSRSDP